MNFEPALSYLGSSIHRTPEARLNDALRFFKVSSNLRLARRCTLEKFARYIRHGFLSVQDAQDIILDRLPKLKMRRYNLAKYWISSGFESESAFYFVPLEAIWQKEEEAGKVVENTTLFPLVELGFN